MKEKQYQSSIIFGFPARVMIGIDLAYNLHLTFGNWFPRSKPLLQLAVNEIMQVTYTFCQFYDLNLDMLLFDE